MLIGIPAQGRPGGTRVAAPAEIHEKPTAAPGGARASNT